MSGSLTLIVGPMFSGKTTYLIDIYDKLMKNNNKVLAINHIIDDRYGKNSIITHSKKSIPSWDLKSLREIYDNFDTFNKHQHILINEGQFFQDLFQIVSIIVEKYKKDVYICGLDGDFNRNKFGNILDLIPICDDIIKLKAKCNICNKDAIFSKRLSNESKQIVVGNDNYIPVCRNCYNS